MLPVIYSASSTEFSSNGQGVLVDCISCEVTEERNGIFEMALTYPESGRHADKLVVDAIIKATAHIGDEGQLFRIYSIEKNLAGDISCQCQHISYQLSFIPCEPFEATNPSQAFTRLQQNMQVKDHRFTFYTDKTTNANFKIKVPTSTRSVLGGMEGSILDTFRGEYEFDNFNVRFLNNRGHDNNVILRYGKNITDITEDCDVAETYTGLRPYYYDEDELVELDTPDKCLWSENYMSFPYRRILVLDCTSEFEELTDKYGDRRSPTQAELMSYAKKYMSNHDFGDIKVSVDIDFEHLWDTPEYASVANLERVNLCDTVHVLFEPYDISVKSKVVKTVYNTLLDRYNSVTIGAARSNFASVLASVPERIDDMLADTSTRLERARQRATATLLGRNGGYKVETVNGEGHIIETLYMDSLDEATATKVWRWNINGLGYSPNGPGGPYTVAITKDGEIVADFITTGTLDADKVNVTNLSAESINVNAKMTLTQALENYDETLADYEDTLVTYETRIEANAQGLSSKVSLTNYNGVTIASLIEQSADSVKIQANHINLNGYTTVGDYFSIDSTTGKLTAKEATISGNITATSLTLQGNAKISSSKVDGLDIYIAADGKVHGTNPTGPNVTGIKVSSQGLLTASNAVIWGNIYAGGGTIAGWEISGKQLIKNTATTGGYTVGINAPADPTSSSRAFYVDDKTGSTTDSVFSVYYDGRLVAKKATIIGDITAKSLTLQGDTKVPASKVNGLSTVATSGSYDDLDDTPNLTVYIQKGGKIDKIGSTPAEGVTGFQVSAAGLLQASNAVIYGTIYASDGLIAGWDINTQDIRKVTTSTIDGDYYRAMMSSPPNPTSTSRAFAVQHASSASATTWTDDFYVNYGGKLYAKNAEIEGKITATEGNIGGCVIENGSISINGNKLVAGSVTGTQVANNTISKDHIIADTITANEINSSVFTSDKLKTGLANLSILETAIIRASQVQVTGAFMYTDSSRNTFTARWARLSGLASTAYVLTTDP